MKTADLTGAALDWTVWKCAGGAGAYPKTASGKSFLKLWQGNSAKYLHPSTDWAQGGPIIEREFIELVTTNHSNALLWQAIGRGFGEDSPIGNGPTPLVAAMRCYVASKLGDEVDIPKELL